MGLKIINFLENSYLFIKNLYRTVDRSQTPEIISTPEENLQVIADNGQMYHLDQISDDWIKILTAVIKENQLIESNAVQNKRREMALPLRQERKRRKLQRFSVYDDLDRKSEIYTARKEYQLPEIPAGFRLKEMPDMNLLIWNALISQVMDYSVLGCGVRKYIDALYRSSLGELKRRGIQPLDPWELKI